MNTWEYRRTVLRQDEVAAFIKATKGEKYIELLPLLGLGQMELAAENLHKLSREVEISGQLSEKRLVISQAKEARTETFGQKNGNQIEEAIDTAYSKYCEGKLRNPELLTRCKEIAAAIEIKMAQSSADERRHMVILDISKIDLVKQIATARVALSRLTTAIEPLILEKLNVLERTEVFSQKLIGVSQVECPACGRLILASELREHVATERARLKSINDLFDSWKSCIDKLCDSIKWLRNSFERPEIKSWKDGLEIVDFEKKLSWLKNLQVEYLSISRKSEDLSIVEANLIPLISAAESEATKAPPNAQALSTDKQIATTVKKLIEARGISESLKRAEALISFISSLEQGVRDEIRQKAKMIIDEISANVQEMWAILHPESAVEDVSLYFSDDADKAIDVQLTFYDIKQDSPRLTLSEGYRNSLGLCIFLAMAIREADKDRPLILDDVIVSLDRDHRGMVQTLLERKFQGRQVIIFTHDRDWFTELRQQLDSRLWGFKVLMPYESPDIGIRWFARTSTFSDARALVDLRPDSAASDARKIMDVELSIISERLDLRLLYRRGEKNDRRTAHEFMERLIADGKRSFQIRAATGYENYLPAIAAWEDLDALLVTWGNRGSHSFDVASAEALKMIDSCEKVLNYFRCAACDKLVWFCEAEGARWCQCQCGQIRWKH